MRGLLLHRRALADGSLGPSSFSGGYLLSHFLGRAEFIIPLAARALSGQQFRRSKDNYHQSHMVQVTVSGLSVV